MHLSPKKNLTNYSVVFNSLIVSFLLIAFLPTLITIILGINFLYSTVNQIDMSHKRMLNDIRREVERSIKDAMNLSSRNANNPLIISYASADERDYFTEYIIRKQLANSMVGYNTISQCYLYLPQFQIVITNVNVLEAKTFYNNNYGIDFEDWKKKVESTNTKVKVLRIPNIKETNDAYIINSHVSFNSRTDLPVTAFSELNYNTLYKNIGEILDNIDGKIMIYNDSGILIDNIGNEKNTWLKSIEENPGNKIISIDNKKFKVFKTYSEIGYFEVLLAIPINYIYDAVAVVGKYILATLIACIVITLFLSFRLARKNYRPIHNICTLLCSEMSAIADNEYDAITQTIQKHMSNADSWKKIFNKNITSFQEMYLEKLLLGKIPFRESILDSCRLYNINFAHKYFMVILFELTEESLLFEDDKFNDQEQHELTKMILKNIVAEMIMTLGTTYIMEVSGKIVAVCNISDKDYCDIEKNLSILIEKTQEFVKENFYINFYTILSKIYLGVDKLPDAYREVIKRANEKEDSEKRVVQESVHPECIEQCIAFIKENYADNNLSISFIATELGLNTSYLSRFFKQQTGIGLLEYLHHYRFSVAKELLEKQPDLVLKDIARQTGFYNVAALIRVFKKIEGQTPGQYREDYLRQSIEKSIS